MLPHVGAELVALVNIKLKEGEKEKEGGKVRERERGEGKRRYKDKIVVINCTRKKGREKEMKGRRDRETYSCL